MATPLKTVDDWDQEVCFNFVVLDGGRHVRPSFNRPPRVLLGAFNMASNWIKPVRTGTSLYVSGSKQADEYLRPGFCQPAPAG